MLGFEGLTLNNHRFQLFTLAIPPLESVLR